MNPWSLLPPDFDDSFHHFGSSPADRSTLGATPIDISFQACNLPRALQRDREATEVDDARREGPSQLEDGTGSPTTGISSSYRLEHEAQFKRNFSCCGLTLSLQDLLQHQETHAEMQKSFITANEPVIPTMLYTDDVLLYDNPFTLTGNPMQQQFQNIQDQQHQKRRIRRPVPTHRRSETC